MARSSSADPGSRDLTESGSSAASGGGSFDEDSHYGDAIVADLGTSTLRIGFAGAERPKLQLPCVVGRLKHPKVLAGGALEGRTE